MLVQHVAIEGQGSLARCNLRVRAKSLPLCLFETLWTVTHQALLSMGFPRQEYWSELLCPPPGDLPNPGIEPVSLMST